MDSKPRLDLREPYFNSLREEVLHTRKRIFRILLAGIIGSPVLTYFALQEQSHPMVILMAPFLVLLLLVLYMSEHASMTQAGRFIRDQIEQDEGDWEHWLTVRRAKSPDPQLFATFSIVCIAFYVILISLAIQRLVHTMPERLTGQPWIDLYMYGFWRFGMPLLYLVATFWIFLTLLRFCRTALRT